VNFATMDFTTCKENAQHAFCIVINALQELLAHLVLLDIFPIKKESPVLPAALLKIV